MTKTPTVNVYTIGQTPRPDLTRQFVSRHDGVNFEIRGALDGLTTDQIPVCPPGGYPLETKLRDDTRVVVDAMFAEALLQDMIADCEDRVDVHMILCAGPFPNLEARKTLIRPFDTAVAVLSQRAIGTLNVVVPFEAQAGPAKQKWVRAGFECRTYLFESAMGDLQRNPNNGAVVIDYVGCSDQTIAELSKGIVTPVFDVGQLALEALDDVLRSVHSNR